MRGHGLVNDPLWVLDRDVSLASLHSKQPPFTTPNNQKAGPVYVSYTQVANNASFNSVLNTN